MKTIILGEGETIKCHKCLKYILPGCYVILFFSGNNTAHSKICAHCYLEYIKNNFIGEAI